VDTECRGCWSSDSLNSDGWCVVCVRSCAIPPKCWPPDEPPACTCNERDGEPCPRSEYFARKAVSPEPCTLAYCETCPGCDAAVEAGRKAVAK
jgi:hypothetical protein